MEFISDLEIARDSLLFHGLEEFLALEGVVLDVMLYDLVGRHVDHVVFDREIRTSGVDWKMLFMVDKDYLW